MNKAVLSKRLNSEAAFKELDFSNNKIENPKAVCKLLNVKVQSNWRQRSKNYC